MGSYKWGYRSPDMGYNYIAIVTLLITPLITPHEPLSSSILDGTIQEVGSSLSDP